MSESAAHTPDEKPTNDAEAAIEAKRDTLERVANTDYPAAEHAEALLEIADNTN
jgi:hypothetical protein